MAPSRKSQSELDRLKSEAEDLWEDQREVLERANRVIRSASRTARREAASRGRDVLDERVRPAVASGLAAGRGVAHAGRERLVDDVFPVVSSALGSALAILEAARNPEVRAALSRAGAVGRRAAGRVGIGTTKSSPGPGRYILIGVGVVALAGVAYAAWQTLRADDDLWIDDEELTEQTGDAQPS
jgi:hypothetical protein